LSVLSIRGASVHYGAGRHAITAVDAVDLDIAAGSVLGLVGESGSGKSTLAKAIVGLAPLASGTITLDGEDICGPGRAARERRRLVQMVFQDPYSSLDPRMTVEETLSEALTVRRRLSRTQRRSEVDRLLELVSLDASISAALPRQLSGGQLQRVSIARALAAEPRLLIADEITSSLDVSVQGSILNMIRDLRAALDVTMLFISHNVAVVRYLSDAIAVMYLGQVVEAAPTDELIADPQHPFTRVLLDAVPGATARWRAEGRLVDGEAPDPHQPPAGCHFHPRCPVGPRVQPDRTICAADDPVPAASLRRHRAACHFVDAE
jgi:peptide/nickel transport system ATP-binding protein